MELEALKTIWLETLEHKSVSEKLSKDDILHATEQKSNTVISKIRKRLKFKVWAQSLIGAFGTVLAISLLLNDELAFGVTYLIVFPMFLALGIHKLKHYRMIVDFQRASPSLKETISRIISIMNKVISAQILTAVVTGTLFAALFSYMGLEKITGLSLLQQVSMVLLISLISPLLLFQIAKRGQQKMFGKYLKKLKEHLAELDEQNENQ